LFSVFRPLDDPRYLAIDVDFDTLDEAEAFRSVLQDLWGSRRATPALAGKPETRIVEQVLSEEY
jgi:hypothetical protein